MKPGKAFLLLSFSTTHKTCNALSLLKEYRKICVLHRWKVPLLIFNLIQICSFFSLKFSVQHYVILEYFCVPCAGVFLFRCLVFDIHNEHSFLCYIQITMHSLVPCAMAVSSLLKLETGSWKPWATPGMIHALYVQ